MERLKLLREQMQRNYERHPFLRKKFEEAGIKPEDIKNFEDLQKLPFITRDELPSYSAEEGIGEDVVRINFSPSAKGLLPIPQTRKDVEVINETNARAFRQAGVSEGDVAVITFGYHIFIAGLNFHGGIEELGAKAVPVGPGSTERVLEIADIVKPTVLISNPSFAIKLASEGLEGIKVLIAAGEPFSAVEGFKDKVKDALANAVTADYYGLAECVPIACECKEENGLHILDEFCYVEIIDPDTGEVVGEGEKGEVVVTHLNKEAFPMQRFRTGDLAVMERFRCECGRGETLPKGVFGRTDEMFKVKGVKFYPSQLNLVLKGIPNLTGRFKAVIKRTEKGTDFLELYIEGRDVDLKKVEQVIKNAILISPNKIELVDKLEKEREVIDERF